ncbi:AcrB/AcrD/AcrF family protein [Sphingomonas koreensis]|jgi:multidrug efflux pump|uniref:AcrB/AcrD/AcrF family protein n=1 Tax=Sphingomonas koreensis TaxID=93064 RepID=A0A1L6JDL9_9SPHN|nr:efflux RND transporter permease subunit [Sphingomonas koreensis]APR53988.1 multidrug transporter AcrB [Sphingomonas koreensis]MDC7808949.1 efflux RND transporter permease subunit [Sphingomonas koreensis]PJI90468.1 multidrug efflux pump [Sphingomonas koreensis]RSU19055.1 AcrB/AcrD/AcrF family protein [Sphingomonas koreensis]RSU24131.1 AcrB/AcrD/AcrF family protein [Sphingomonas koreensis]
MQLSDVSVRRPVFAAVLSILLTIVGVVAFLSLSVREYPDTDPPVVSVETVYTGAAASVVEARITQPIEEALSGIEGIQTITSRSRDGSSDISIEFRPGRDIDSAANDVRDRIGSVTEDLPEEALAPEVRKVDADSSPILFLVVSRPGWSRLELSDYVDRNLVDRFSTIDGVARVFVGGEARPSMRVWLDANKLAAFQLTPADVETALRTQNVELPAGRIESQQQNVTLRVDRPFASAESFTRLVVGRGPDGYQVKLGDIAKVEQGAENPYTTFRMNGQSAVGMGIVRQSGANTLAVADAAKKTAAGLDLPEGMTITVGSDDSLFIGRAIEGVWHTLAEAAVLVVLVIFLFLGSWRATLIPAVTVPICLLGAFAVLWAFGFSINLLTLLALVLAIGLVVDDAIVVLENVYHRIEEGEPPLVAAFKGTRQVGFAVISTTLVVCAVFVPICFLAGQTGLLFRELAVAMIGAVAFSGFLALSLTPMLCSKMLKKQERGRFTGWVDDKFQKLENFYGRWLDKAINRPLIPMIGVLLFLGVAVGGFLTLQSELVPAEDQGVAQVQLSAPEGTGFDQMDRYVVQTQEKLLPLLNEGAVRTVISRTPGGFGASDDFNSGMFIVFLKPWEDRTTTTQQVAQQINRILVNEPAIRGNAQVRSALGRGRGQPIGFVLAGTTYEDLAKARDRILAAAAQNPGIINLDSDYKETKPQLRVDVDTTRAGDLGVSVNDVSQALQTLLGSRRVSTYVDRGEEYRVIVQADAAGRATLANLSTIQVRARDGSLVPLSNLVTTREVSGPRDLGRFNKLRAITLSGAVAPGYSLGEALTFLQEQAAASPEVIAVGYRGESQAFVETGGSILLVFGLTILIVYLVLAAQFESFVHPGVIIMTVPLAVAGGVLGLAVMGKTLNLYSQIGIVMLVGLAAKNGILIVEFANQLRDEGRSIAEAIRQASARRLRAILMTSIAMAAGAVPLMFASGAGAAARQAIGVVIVFGVILATMITLFLIPILYSRLAKWTGSPQAVSRELEAAMGEPQAAE